MKRRKVVIVGTGGMGREALWLVTSHNNAKPRQAYNVLGFLTNAKEEHGKTICGKPVLGSEEWIAGKKDIDVICAIGDPRDRRQVVSVLKERGTSFATLIDPSVRMSEFIKIGVGCIICAGVVLTTQVRIGDHVIVNVHSTVSHDSILEDFVTVGPGVQITGWATIGYGAELGANSVVTPRKRVGRGVLVGAGAVVIKDVQDNTVVGGIPARKIKIFPKRQRL
jgi:sugar O-acyltransferase (sialic acid O-acetyltransferase NeuD family)